MPQTARGSLFTALDLKTAKCCLAVAVFRWMLSVISAATFPLSSFCAGRRGFEDG
jgi:hypothetical protein